MHCQNTIVLLTLCAAGLLWACDSGDIYPVKEEQSTQRQVSAAYTFSGSAAFPEEYKVIFAAFKDTDYPLTAVQIATVNDSTTYQLSLSNLPTESEKVGLYLVRQYGNKLIHAFSEVATTNWPEGSHDLGLNHILLASYGRIQAQVFTQCIQCHGGSGSSAAGLDLTPLISYQNLIDIAATKAPEMKRVYPGSPTSSYIVDVLEGRANLRYNHADISSLKNDDLQLLNVWILNGAENN
jgi:hypothetical protein